MHLKFSPIKRKFLWLLIFLQGATSKIDRLSHVLLRIVLALIGFTYILLHCAIYCMTGEMSRVIFYSNSCARSFCRVRLFNFCLLLKCQREEYLLREKEKGKRKMSSLI